MPDEAGNGIGEKIPAPVPGFLGWGAPFGFAQGRLQQNFCSAADVDAAGF